MLKGTRQFQGARQKESLNLIVFNSSKIGCTTQTNIFFKSSMAKQTTMSLDKTTSKNQSEKFKDSVNMSQLFVDARQTIGKHDATNLKVPDKSLQKSYKRQK